MIRRAFIASSLEDIKAAISVLTFDRAAKARWEELEKNWYCGYENCSRYRVGAPAGCPGTCKAPGVPA